MEHGITSVGLQSAKTCNIFFEKLNGPAVFVSCRLRSRSCPWRMPRESQGVLQYDRATLTAKRDTGHLLRPRPALGQTWLQVLSEGRSAFDVAHALGDVFEEQTRCTALKGLRLTEDLRLLALSLALRKSMQAESSERVSQQMLMLQHSRRLALETIRSSWSEFCTCFDLMHFPVTEHSAKCFVSFIQHGSSKDKYLQHLGWAHRFLSTSDD